MVDLAGIPHMRAVRAFERVGFRVLRQGKHIVMTDGVHNITIPRHNPIKPFTLAGIVRSAGLTTEQFREML